MSSKTISYMNLKKPTSTIVHERMHRIEKYLKSKIDHPGKWNKSVMDVPQQSNGYDCGIYVCMFVYWTCFLEEVPSFNQANVDDHGRESIFTSIEKNRFVIFEMYNLLSTSVTHIASKYCNTNYISWYFVFFRITHCI